MKRIDKQLARRSRTLVRLARRALAFAMLMMGGQLWAAPPLDPLPVPLFCLDPQSPEIAGGMFSAADVLRVTGTNTVVEIPGGALGLGQPGDVLDSMSRNEAMPLTTTFVLRFSVDRETVGTAMTDPVLAALQVPYNVADQAARGHAAGDLYMSSGLFDRTGPLPDGQSLLLAGGNSALVDNQYDEGGNDFNTDPPTSAEAFDDGTQGNVGGTMRPSSPGPSAAANAGPGPNAVYFTAASGSPSLQFLPGGASPSGARIFFNPSPGQPGSFTVEYAAFFQLGLQQGDDIDGMLVFDQNFNGDFDSSDQVLFTLTPDSPSLKGLPGGQEAGGAHVFSVFFGTQPQFFAPAFQLGMGLPNDNIDALELDLCQDATACAAVRGIRRLKGDCDNDGDLALDDFECFYPCLSGPDKPLDLDGGITYVVGVGPGVDFNPPLTVIERGDSVQWIWMGGLHNVVSGMNGVANGFFSSGPPTSVVGNSFTVTFDDVFCSSHPVPAGVYHYFCAVHAGFGLPSRIAVKPPACALFDFADDRDVDLRDYAAFQNTFGQ